MFHGGAVTYFIVIIFQFYLLHWLFSKYLIGLNPIKMIVISILITTMYWAMRTFISPPNNPILAAIWDREGWMIFIGWLSYFLLGFYIGTYYEAFMNKIKDYTWHIIIGAFLSIILCFKLYIGYKHMGRIKRVDTPIYVTMVILLFSFSLLILSMYQNLLYLLVLLYLLNSLFLCS